MGGRASSESKQKWNRKTYDFVQITVPKGTKDAIKKYAAEHGVSVNDLIKTAIQEKTGIDLTTKAQQERGLDG